MLTVFENNFDIDSDKIVFHQFRMKTPVGKSGNTSSHNSLLPLLLRFSCDAKRY